MYKPMTLPCQAGFKGLKPRHSSGGVSHKGGPFTLGNGFVKTNRRPEAKRQKRNPKSESRNPKQTRTNFSNSKTSFALRTWCFAHLDLFRISDFELSSAVFLRVIFRFRNAIFNRKISTMFGYDLARRFREKFSRHLNRWNSLILSRVRG
jgi:hypothetical protein